MTLYPKAERCQSARRTVNVYDKAYLRLQNVIREQILAGDVRPGERLPTERELGERHGVSRITTRHALRVLEEQGLIERLPGKGTFVRENRARKISISEGDYTGSLRRASRQIVRRLVRYEPVQPPREVRDALRLLAGESCVLAVRVDDLDNEPVAYDHAYFLLRHRDSLDPELLVRVDFLARWIDRAGIRLSHSQEIIESVAAGPEAAGLLKIAQGSPLLVTTEVMSDAAGVAVHVAESYYLGDRFRLTETVSAENVLGRQSRAEKQRP